MTLRNSMASPKYWTPTMRADLVANTFNPVSQHIYLIPFSFCGQTTAIPLGLKVKFDYAAIFVPGFQWSFTFRTALYRVQRGLGGTTATATIVPGFPVGLVQKGSGTGDPTTGTIYTVVTAANPPAVLEGGLYVWGIKWEDISTIPSRVAWTSYGGTMIGTTGQFYYLEGGIAAGAMPTTIATVATAQTVLPYIQYG